MRSKFGMFSSMISSPLSVSRQPFSTSLPGAWRSTWSFNEAPIHSSDILNEESQLALVDNEGIQRRTVGDCTARRSVRISVATIDNESVWSDDYYSFVSQGDDDADLTLVPGPNSLNDVPIKDAGDDGGVFSAFQLEKPGRMSPLICDAVSNLHQGSAEDTPGDLSPPELSIVHSSSLSSTSEESNCTPDFERDFSYPSQIFLNPTEDGGRTPRTSVASSSLKASIHSRLSSSASAHLADGESNHNLDLSEDESAISYGHVYNLVKQLDYSNESEESISPRLLPTTPQVRRSLQAHRPVERQESQLDIMNLSQPDGDNPWTLALGPFSTGILEPASMSRTSVSVESSSVTHAVSLAAQPPPRVQTPTSFLSSRSATQNEFRSEVGLGPPSSLRSTVPLSYYNGPTPANPVQKKDAIQKTKNFYQKMKRLFTPKSSKPTLDKGISNDMRTSPYSHDSPSQRSLYRRAFFRTAKSSTPSVAHSNPEFPYNSSHHPPVMTREQRHTFEYRRPPALDGIKPYSKRDRRLSVPTSVSRSSSRLPGGNPSFRSFTTSSSHVQRKVVQPSKKL